MAPDQPRVTVGLPVFNGERFLEEALDSLLAQTYEDLELVISDNASTDRTQEICTAYAARDPRIRYHRGEQNRGLAWNHNRVFELSGSEYFKWAGHDDYCAPQFIERCVDALDRMPAVVVAYPRAVLVDEHGERLDDFRDNCQLDSPRANRRFQHLLMNLRLSNPMYGVIRASALRKVPLGSYIAADIVMLGALALHGRLYELPENLFFRRRYPNGSNQAPATAESLAVLFDPANRGKVPMREWRLTAELMAAIHRAPITVGERARCYGFMAKWIRWKWKDLGRDLTRWVTRTRL